MHHPKRHPPCPCVPAACLSCPARLQRIKPPSFRPATALQHHSDPSRRRATGAGADAGAFGRFCARAAARRGDSRSAFTPSYCIARHPRQPKVRPFLRETPDNLTLGSCERRPCLAVFSPPCFSTPYPTAPLRACAHTDEAGPSSTPPASPWAGRTRGTGRNQGQWLKSRPGGVYDLPPGSPTGVRNYFDSYGRGCVSPCY